MGYMGASKRGKMATIQGGCVCVNICFRKVVFPSGTFRPLWTLAKETLVDRLLPEESRSVQCDQRIP